MLDKMSVFGQLALACIPALAISLAALVQAVHVI